MIHAARLLPDSCNLDGQKVSWGLRASRLPGVDHPAQTPRHAAPSGAGVRCPTASPTRTARSTPASPASRSRSADESAEVLGVLGLVPWSRIPTRTMVRAVASGKRRD